MAYIVTMNQRVRAYLWTFAGLTRQGRLSLVAGTLNLLRNHGDALRSDPLRRLAPGSPFFRFDHLFADASGFWQVDCIADDSAAAYGVIEIVYLDCKQGP